MKNIYKAQPYITPTASVSTCTPDQYLSEALAFTRQSHDAVLVFDKKGNFLGLVSPYHAIFEHRFPYTAKVKHCLFVPPRITTNTPLHEVAQRMVDTRVYTLPVVDDAGEIAGETVLHQAMREIESQMQRDHQVAHEHAKA